MAVLKNKAMRELEGAELEKKIAEWRVELSRERAAVKTTGKPNNPGKMREFRRTIARALTLQHQRAKKALYQNAKATRKALKASGKVKVKPTTVETASHTAQRSEKYNMGKMRRPSL